MVEESASQPAEATTPVTGSGPGIARCMLAAASASIIGATLLGLLEYTVARVFFRHGLDGEPWPTGLEPAAAGMLIVSYVLLLLPILLAAGGVYAFLMRRRPSAVPEPWLLALVGLPVAAVVVPADLQLAHYDTLLALIPAVGLVLYVAAMVWVLGRIAVRRLGSRRVLRVYYVAAVLCGLVGIVCGVAFYCSPLWNPAYYDAGGLGWQPAAAGEDRADTQATRPPDVLWIVLDTARADRMSLYGYTKPTTPFLQRLAGETRVYDRAISNGMWTVPSHASMFTGRPVREHGMSLGARALLPRFRTVAELLDEHGYQTVLLTNNPLLTTRTMLARGFVDRFTVFTYMRSLRFSLERWVENLGMIPPLPWLDRDYGAALTNHLAAGWLREHRERPVFMFVNYMEAHLPYRSPRRYRAQFLSDEAVRRSYALRRRVHGEIENWLHEHAIIEGYDDMPQLDRDTLCGQYDAGLRYLDDRIAELLDLFAAAGRLDNTLVIITGDHGEYLDTHNMWSHHFLTYQDVVHVPLIIRPPGGGRGRRIERVAQLTDLYTTVLRATLGAAAVTPTPRAIDLLAADADTASAAGSAPRYAVAECYGPGKKLEDQLLALRDRAFRHRACKQLAVVGPRFKYVESSDGQLELFDLTADPGELHNLATTSPESMRPLAAYLARWKRAVPKFDVRAAQPGGQWSPDVLKQLGALGYVGGDDSP